jgi:hypothetical protein
MSYPPAALNTSLTHRQRYAAIADVWTVEATTDTGAVTWTGHAIGMRESLELAEPELRALGYQGIRFRKAEKALPATEGRNRGGA